MKGLEYLSPEARAIIFIHDGARTRDVISAKLGLSSIVSGKMVNILIDKGLAEETNDFLCPHCGKKIEGLTIKQKFLYITEDGIKKYNDILKLQELILDSFKNKGVEVK